MKSLAALCAGVMTLCAASSLFVSCDTYDDSILKEEIENLKGDVSDIKQSIEALQNDLRNLTSRVEEFCTLEFKVENNVLKYSFDGQTWISTDVILADPTDIDFKVEDNTLYYSEDGGQTWTSTGFTLPENSGSTGGASYNFQFKVEDGKIYFTADGTNWIDTGATIVDPCNCPKAELVDNGDSVTITIGDASFTIEKPEEIVFEIKAGKVYFSSEDTQVVTIKSTGVEDVTVMAYPKGWYAEMNADGFVEITAPNIADTEVTFDENWNEIPGKAAPKGYVKIHACSAEGKCMVGKLSVEVTNSPVIVKAYGGKFEIATTSRWSTVYYGISEKSTYEADAAVLLDAMASNNWDVLDEWPTYTNTTITGNIADVLGYEPELGKEYVVWAFLDGSEMPTINDLVLAFYSPINVTAVEDEAQRTPYDNYITVEVQGADSYYALAVPSNYADNVENFKSQMIEIEYGGLGKLMNENYEGSFYQITMGTNSYVGSGVPGTTGYLLILPIDGRPNDQYTIDDIRTFEFNTSELEHGGTVTTTATQVFEAMGYNYETYEQEMMPLDPYTELGVSLAAPEGTWKYFYFGWFSEDAYNLTGGDSELLADAIITAPSGYPISPEESEWPNIIVNSQCEPGQTVYFVAFFLDENYKIGELVKMELATKELVKSEMTLDPVTNLVDNTLKNTTSFEITFNPSETASKYRYVKVTTGAYNQYAGKTEAEMAEIIYFANDYTAKTIKSEDLVEGKWTLSTGFAYGSSYYIAVLPYDEEGNPAQLAYILEFDCVFQLDNVVSDAAQFVSEPTIEFTIPANENGAYGVPGFYAEGTTANYELNYTVKPVEGTEVASLFITSALASDYGYDNSVDASKKASGLWAKNLIAGQKSYTYNHTEETTTSPRTFRQYDYNAEGATAITGTILVSWKDAEGNYYYKEVDLTSAFAWMYNTLMGTETSEKPGTIVSPSTETETPETPAEPTVATVAEFLAAEVGDTWYQLTGIIESVANTSYGNFNLKDDTGTVYVYGLTATQVESNDQSFSSLNLRAGDQVTLIGKRAVYNEKPQVGGPAYYVSHVDNTPDVEVADGNVAITLVTNAYKDESTINGTPTYTYKIGTSKATGSIDVTIPAGTTKVKCNAVAWKGTENATVEVKSGDTVLATLPINANDGASGNAPYTITTDGDSYELPFAVTEETVVTVTSASRVIFWNIIAE